jgi:hypothetical protein
MEVKILEIRDHATMIPVLCVNLGNADNDGQRYLMRRCGYPLDGEPNIAICHLRCGLDRITNDPYQWQDGARTYPRAHLHIIENWHDLRDGDVVDVEFIAGETAQAKKSERFGFQPG